jgi:protocatechuate 3,4-dioxygenase beta subunit
MQATHLLVSLSLFTVIASAQVIGLQRPQPAPPTGPPQLPGSVAGKVTNALTGEPVKRATVNLRGPTGYVTVSDASGNFIFDNVQPADYYFASADSEGYVNQGGRQPAAIKVAPQQEVKDIALQLTPLSVISGKVLNDDGEPLQGANVQTLSYQYQNGVRRLIGTGSGSTDDRGQYRIFDLMPGHYFVVATMRALTPAVAGAPEHIHSTVPEEGYARSYHPGAAEISQASQIDVKPGAEMNGVDFKLRKVAVYHIRGTIVDAQTRQPVRANIQLQECENGAFNGFGMQTGAAVQPNGNFDMKSIVAGSYCLIVRQGGQRGLFARQTITVKNEDINGVVLSVSAGIEVQGSITIDGTPPANLPRVFVRLESVDGMMGSQNPEMKPDSTFTIANVFPGPYNVVVQGVSQQMYVKSLQYGNQDVSNGKIQVGEAGSALGVTLGTDPGQVSGTVQASSGGPAARFTGIVAAAGGNEDRRDLQRIFGGQDGSFRAAGLAPGDYKVFIFEGDNFQDLQNTDLRHLLEDKAASVTVHAGGNETVQVRAISVDAVTEAKGRLQ